MIPTAFTKLTRKENRAIFNKPFNIRNGEKLVIKTHYAMRWSPLIGAIKRLIVK